MMGVRWREDVGWEMACPDCKANGRQGFYWPLLPEGEFWSRKCLSRCKACELRRLVVYRARTGATNGGATNRSRNAAAARRRYYLHREEILAAHRAKYAADRERILADRKRRYYERKAA